MARNQAVFGIYPSMSALHVGAEALKAAGFRQTDISVLYSDKSGTKEFGHEAHTKAPEGAAAGAATGRFSRQVRSLRRSRVLARRARPADCWARWWDWASRSTRPSGTKVACAKAAC
jgi:hypothetical protein